MRKTDITKLIDLYNALWPRAKLAEDTAREWFHSLHKFSWQCVEKAIRSCADEKEFPAPLNEIKARANKNHRTTNQNYFRCNAEQKGHHMRAALKMGMVPVFDRCEQFSYLTFYRRNDCINVNGRWLLKIDFIIQQLGIDVLLQQLKTITKNSSIAAIVENFNDDAMREHYYHTRERLTEAALEVYKSKNVSERNKSVSKTNCEILAIENIGA